MSRLPMENQENRKREQISIWCSKEWHDKITKFATSKCKSISAVSLEIIQDRITEDEKKQELKNKRVQQCLKCIAP